MELRIDKVGYLHLPIASLNQQERQLIKEIFKTLEYGEEDSKDPWYRFIRGVGHLPSDAKIKSGCIVQFYVEYMAESINHQDFLRAIRGMFSGVISADWITRDSGFIILSDVPSNGLLSEIKDFVALIDSDFYTKTRIYVGLKLYWEKYNPSVFTFEQNLFKNSTQSVNSLVTNLLPFLAKQEKLNLTLLKQQLILNDEEEEMILALFSYQGNVNKTAENLFLHKNTLLYRIEKFKKRTGINLRDIKSLACCYLLVIA